VTTADVEEMLTEQETPFIEHKGDLAGEGYNVTKAIASFAHLALRWDRSIEGEVLTSTTPAVVVRLSPRTNLLMFREWAPLQTAARVLEWAGLYGRVSVKGDCIGLAAVARIERNGRTSETGPPTFGQLPLGGTLTIPPLSRSDSSSQG
jgi:hypothetical protein